MNLLETVVSVDDTGVEESQHSSDKGDHLEYEEECEIIDRD